VIVKAATWHTPPACDSSSSGVFGGQQAAPRRHYRVRREALPDSRSHLITQN
jgi:hypothetical protein